MNNTEKYKLLLENEISMESNMAIIPREKGFALSVSNIKVALSKSKDFKLLSFEEVNNKNDNVSINEIDSKAVVEYLNEKFEIEIYSLKATDLHLQKYGFANNIDEESLRIALEQENCIAVSMYFGEDNISSFHLQLKLLYTIVPNACLVIDFMSYRLLSPYWLKMTAESPIPPSPDYLYTLHCVYDDSKGEDSKCWFHTHGLQRCGSVELEMLNISMKGYEQMNVLINMTIKKFLSDPAKERERFMIGYDGMGINLCWLRWEEVLKDFPKDLLGGMEDREGEDNVHNDPAGVLFAVEDGNMISPEIYTPTLSVNPIYYITNQETNRMSALAKERFNLFKDTFYDKQNIQQKQNFIKKIFNKKKKQEADWEFLVKLGLAIDTSNNDETGDEKEHLWFEVLSINGNEIKGKLLNQPYWIAKLNEGDVRTYPFELLTDWIIYAPEMTYTPDTIYQLTIKVKEENQ